MTTRVPEPRPLCDAGRCAQLLVLIAKREAGFADREGGKLAEVIRGVLREFGVDPGAAAVRESVARHCRQVVAGGQRG